MLHSAAALLKIAEMNYSGGNSIFIRTLIEKRYALPFRVVDALVHHFIKYVYLIFIDELFLFIIDFVLIHVNYPSFGINHYLLLFKTTDKIYQRV
jgi:hypothetical protein